MIDAYVGKLDADAFWVRKRDSQENWLAFLRFRPKVAFVATCRHFVQLCRQAGLIAGELVVIERSKFPAVASSRNQMSLKQLQRQEQAQGKRIYSVAGYSNGQPLPLRKAPTSRCKAMQLEFIRT